MPNQYGLPRQIPPDIAFEIRKKSGFGCVICGTGIIEYDHVDPEFKDAKIHNPQGMTVLCPTCHAKKTRKFLSIETVKTAMKNPKCLEQGFSKEILDIGTGYPILIFAGSSIQNCTRPITVSGTPLFEIKQPEVQGGPFRLSANFYDSAGANSLKIIDNEWRASASNWDIVVSAGKIEIKDDADKTHLILKTIDSTTIEVSKIESKIGNIKIIGDKDKFQVVDQTGGTTEFKNCICSDCVVGFSL